MSLQKLIKLSPLTKSINRLNLLQFNRSLCSVSSSNKSAEANSSNQNESDKISNQSDKLGQLDNLDDKLHSGDWHISCGLVIQRFPLVTPEFNLIEKSFHEYNVKLEYEKSLLSDYDYAIECVKNQNSKKEEDLKLVANYELFQKEAKAFKTSGKKTDADLTNDQKSHQRCLDRSIFLVTNLNVGKNENWSFPFEILNKQDESLREVAERLLEQIADKSKFRILGNSPFTYLKFAYPKAVRERMKKKGNKIFYLKCQLIDLKSELNLKNKDLFLDYKWLTTDECSKALVRPLWKCLNNGLLAENMDEMLLDLVNKRLNERRTLNV